MKRSRTWKALIGDVLSDIYPKMESMTDRELMAIRRAPIRKSSTNCWWLTFTFADALSEIAGHILTGRRLARKAALRAEPPA